MSEDFILELARLERETLERVRLRNARNQTGEQFKVFAIPSRPFRQSEEQ